MKHLGHIWIVVLLLLFSVNSGPAHALDWLTLQPTIIQAVIGSDGTYRSPDNGVDTWDVDWEAGIRIDQRGYILDPAIVDFSLSLEPLYTWGLFDAADEPNKYSGKNLSYVFYTDILRGTPGPFAYNLSALRATNFNSSPLGGRYDNETESKSAAVYWKNPAFPMDLTFTDRLLKQTFLSGKSDATSATTQRDEHVKTLTVKGRSTKTRLFAEHLALDNLLPGRDLDYELDRINLQHKLPWGMGSGLNSRIEYFDRSGFNTHKRFNLDERASIQHTETINSLTNYSFSSITRVYKTTLNNVSFNLSHRLYNNLVTTANLTGLSQTSDPQDLTRWGGGVATQYNKELFGVGVTAGLGYSYLLTDRDTREELTEVIDESHVVPLGGAVILNQRFIVIATVLVTNADGSLVYTDGIDYTVLDLPEDLTQVQIIPGGRIELGETILVSYKAIALPSQKYSTTNTRYNLGLNLGWVRFSHSYSDNDESQLSGQGESFLSPRRDVRTNLDFQWNMSNIEFQLSGERKFYRFKEFESTIYTFRQNLSWDLFGNTIWNLNTVQSFTESTNLDTDLYNLELSVEWQPLINLSIRPRLGAWKRFDERESLTADPLAKNERDDLFITAGFTLRWTYRKVTAQMAYFHNQRTTTTQQATSRESSTKDHRVMFNMTRRFF